MGLSAPKKRTKLSLDPNNTTWSKSPTNFGHRMLSKQGWKPGAFLGAENAGHAAHYTAANASHIRVLLREDRVGIGAGRDGGGRGGAETFGLSVFSGVLGRLNGKGEGEVRDAVRDVQLRLYQERKHGTMNFVSGGVLVGDRMEPSVGREEGLVGRGGEVQEESKRREKKKRKVDEVEVELEESSGSTKRRKGSTDTGVVDGDAAVAVKSGKRSKKDREGKGRRERQGELEGRVVASGSTQEVADLKSKKRKSKKSRRESGDTSDSKSNDEKTRLKAEKRARKEERRKRGEANEQGVAEMESAEEKKNEADKRQRKAKPAASRAMDTFGGSRHAVRHRYIQQKRMASMDAQAMKEIFMLKGMA